MITTRARVGAEPGVDPRRGSADIQYGGIRQNCVIEVFDYSSVRHSFGRMTNKEFVNFLGDEGASKPEPWVKVRWINIGGMSWDVIKAVSLKYGTCTRIRILPYLQYFGQISILWPLKTYSIQEVKPVPR